MRFSWTLKELHALRIALTDAQFFQSDLQERLVELEGRAWLTDLSVACVTLVALRLR